jgi:hypothetical protein
MTTLPMSDELRAILVSIDADLRQSGRCLRPGEDLSLRFLPNKVCGGFGIEMDRSGAAQPFYVWAPPAMSRDEAITNVVTRLGAWMSAWARFRVQPKEAAVADARRVLRALGKDAP